MLTPGSAPSPMDVNDGCTYDASHLLPHGFGWKIYATSTRRHCFYGRRVLVEESAALSAPYL